jgi:hypothetical protein
MKRRVIIFCSLCCAILASCIKNPETLGKDCMTFNDSIEYNHYLQNLENEIDSLQILREKLKFDILNQCIIDCNLKYELYNDSLQKELNRINQQIFNRRNDLKKLSNNKFNKN